MVRLKQKLAGLFLGAALGVATLGVGYLVGRDRGFTAGRDMGIDAGLHVGYQNGMDAGLLVGIDTGVALAEECAKTLVMLSNSRSSAIEALNLLLRDAVKNGCGAEGVLRELIERFPVPAAPQRHL